MKMIKIHAKKSEDDARVTAEELRLKGFEVRPIEGPYDRAVWDGTELGGVLDDVGNGAGGVYVVTGTKDVV